MRLLSTVPSSLTAMPAADAIALAMSSTGKLTEPTMSVASPMCRPPRFSSRRQLPADG